MSSETPAVRKEGLYIYIYMDEFGSLMIEMPCFKLGKLGISSFRNSTSMRCLILEGYEYLWVPQFQPIAVCEFRCMTPAGVSRFFPKLFFSGVYVIDLCFEFFSFLFVVVSTMN